MKLEILFKFPMVGAKIRNYVIRKEGGGGRDRYGQSGNPQGGHSAD